MLWKSRHWIWQNVNLSLVIYQKGFFWRDHFMPQYFPLQNEEVVLEWWLKKYLIKSEGIPCSTEILSKNLVHTSVNSIILVKDEDTWICPPACLPLTPDLSLASSDAGVTSLDGKVVRLRGWTSVVLPTVSGNGTFTGAWPWLWRRKGSKHFRITGLVWVVTGSLWGESWMERGEVTFSPSLCGAVRFIL